MSKHFVVVGAGIGGLATAARLAHRGHRVTVLEKTSEIGGRNRSEQVGECKFDGGPTLMMMLDPFKKLFSDLGERLEDHLQISLCDPSYRVFYSDQTQIDGTPNVAKMLATIESKFGEKEASKYPEFLGDIARLYNDSIPNFVRTNYSKFTDIVAPSQLMRVVKSGMLGNLSKRVARTFTEDKLRMLFSFQTMYLGISPYNAPWVYGTLAYMEYGEGIWYPQGGMPEISRAILGLAKRRGVEVRLDSTVRGVSSRSVVLEDGEVLQCDAVICNADLPYSQRQLEEQAPRRNLRYSCSALVYYIEYEGQIPNLLHHNVFFGQDFKGNLDSIFEKNELPDDPSFYACLSNRSEPGRSPEGYENLYLLVPVPNLDFEWSDAAEAEIRRKVFSRLETETCFKSANVKQVKSRSPRDWESELNLEKGAAFGLSHDLFQSAFMRPKNVSPVHKGVYYVGASTSPGNGLPMVLISAELVEKRLEEDGILENSRNHGSKLSEVVSA